MKDDNKLNIKDVPKIDKICEEMAKVLVKYLDNPENLMIALDHTLNLIKHDYKNDTNIYKDIWCKKRIRKIGYLCRKCALEGGAIPPINHVCTMHYGICNICDKEKSLCHTSDWDWPNDPELQRNREF